VSEQQTFDPQAPITLSLTLTMVQGILTGLGKLPFEQVAGLVELIRAQSTAQLQPTPTETTGETA